MLKVKISKKANLRIKHLCTEQDNVAKDGVNVHEDVVNHNVDVSPLPLDDVLIINTSKHRAHDLQEMDTI